MKLYHGTSETVARQAIQPSEGLKPRALLSASNIEYQGNWKHNTLTSNPDCVYLTSCYAGYFAINATDTNSPPQRYAVVEVDTDRLQHHNLLPDEDCLEQGTRDLPDAILKGQSMRTRTLWFRDHLQDFQQYWELSLATLGTCCYRGTIPPHAITRIAIFDFTHGHNPLLKVFMDPSISIQNHAYCASKYVAATKWLFGDPTTVYDHLDFIGATPDLIQTLYPDLVEQITSAMKLREVEILNVN